MPFVLEVQKRAVEMLPSRTNQHVLKVVESLSKVYEVLYNGGYFLSDDELTLLKHHLDRMAKHFQLLQVQSFDDGKARWKTTVKMHYVCAHLHTQAKLINPRHVQGYTSESLVDEICGIYAKSQSGPHHSRIQEVCLLKYRTAIKLLWA